MPNFNDEFDKAPTLAGDLAVYAGAVVAIALASTGLVLLLRSFLEAVS